MSSRTAKSIHNAKIALVFYCINLVLQFFSRKIFLDYLGSEVLGLNTTAQNLLGFLNIAELGIGAAVSYNLYKPLFENDWQAINDIVSIQGWLYRRIAWFVIVSSCVLMCFFPLIFEKAQVPLWYTYGSFIALLVSSLLGYFINYRQIVLSADQKEYKITYCVQGIKIIKVFLQTLVIWLLSNGYIYWMIVEMAMGVVVSIVLNKVIKNEYPRLLPTVSKGWELQKLHPEIITKTKQVFFHKIAGFVLLQTCPLIIYAYASLTVVAIYGNYMLIIAGINALFVALLNSVNAGVGNLVAEGNKQRIKAVFWELTVFRMWLASVVCFGIYMLGHSFITLWIGKEYLLPQTPFILLIFISFISMTRTNDTFISAYGLYQDTWAPITEALLNLCLSILLGYYYGLTGILSGILISLLVIVCAWKPYFLFSKGFGDRFIEYILHYIKYIGLLFISFFTTQVIIWKYLTLSCDTYFRWVEYGIIFILIYSVISLVLLFSIDKVFRNFIIHFFKLIKQ